jgi:hypothetical protein
MFRKCQEKNVHEVEKVATIFSKLNSLRAHDSNLMQRSRQSNHHSRKNILPRMSDDA